MSVTIMPAPDQSGASAGWEMLARALAQSGERKRERQSNYQDLVIKLSDPSTTQDQQNAILSQDPEQFKAFYGVDLSTVGEDVAQFRTAAKDVTASNGMVMTGIEPAGNKRVLVKHPGGTAQEQQQAATLESTQVNTGADRARMKLNESQAALASKDMQLNVGKAVASGKATLRTLDGKVPTFNDMNAYFEGKLELNPLKPEHDEREKLAFILNQDPNDPVGKVMLHAFDNDIKKGDLSVDSLFENVRNVRADASLKERELELINAGLNPRTGQPANATDMIKPNELMALGKGWDEAIAKGMAPLGFPSRTEASSLPKLPFTNMVLNNLQLGPFKTPMPQVLWSKSVNDNSKIGAALFGNGLADPVNVRRDLLAAVPEGQKLLRVDFPTIDQKTGETTTTQYSIDELVPVVVQMRRAWTTSMPALFTAMSQASPATLIYMANGNPMIMQAAKAYRPDIYKMITEARAAADAAAVPPPADDPARTDPITAPMVNDVRKLQKQIDELHQMLQGATVAPGEQ